MVTSASYVVHENSTSFTHIIISDPGVCTSKMWTNLDNASIHSAALGHPNWLLALVEEGKCAKTRAVLHLDKSCRKSNYTRDS